MTLEQMTTVKRWHATHKRARSLETGLWDAMLTCWVMAWIGVPVALMLATSLGFGLCLVLHCAPGAYVGMRARLHQRGVLRCDWLGSARLG